MNANAAMPKADLFMALCPVPNPNMLKKDCQRNHHHTQGWDHDHG